MPFIYKIDVLKMLKAKDYNTSRIRQEKIMGEAMLQKLRHGQMVSWNTLDTLCRLLDCQPGDIIEYIDSEQSSEV